MNLLTIRNGNIPYVVQNERYASSGDFVLILFAIMKGRMVLDIVDRNIINRKIIIQRVYNKNVIECISLNIRNSFIWRRCTRKLVHPRHMNSFRIFYDIHSITYTYFTAVKMSIFV